MFTDFFEYIDSFHIFMLYETHIEEGQESQLNKYFKNFGAHWKFAERTSNFGRASGGVLVGCNLKKIKNCNVQVKNVQKFFVIEIIIDSVLNKVINVVPLYLRGSIWYQEFDSLKKLMENGMENVILAGDVNVRIGRLQNNLDENIFRMSNLLQIY